MQMQDVSAYGVRIRPSHIPRAACLPAVLFRHAVPVLVTPAGSGTAKCTTEQTMGVPVGVTSDSVPQWVHAISGGFAGAMSRLVVGPLDVVKIRMQVQLEPIAHGMNSKYTGLRQALFSIFREEGLHVRIGSSVRALRMGIASNAQPDCIPSERHMYLASCCQMREHFTPASWSMACAVRAQPLSWVQTVPNAGTIREGKPAAYNNSALCPSACRDCGGEQPQH
jgi:hypothetical protein